MIDFQSFDETDKKIITELRKNSRISMTELGKMVFMTSQAVKNRIERLQDMGVVERYTINVNCPIFGYMTHGIFLLLLLEDREKDFLSFAQKTDFHILHCYRTGKRQFFLDCHFHSEDSRAEFQRELEKYGKVKYAPVKEEIVTTHPSDD